MFQFLGQNLRAEYLFIILIPFTISLISGLKKNKTFSVYSLSSLLFCSWFIWMLFYFYWNLYLFQEAQWGIDALEAFKSINDIKLSYNSHIRYYTETRGYLLGIIYFVFCLFISKKLIPSKVT